MSVKLDGYVAMFILIILMDQNVNGTFERLVSFQFSETGGTKVVSMYKYDIPDGAVGVSLHRIINEELHTHPSKGFESVRHLLRMITINRLVFPTDITGWGIDILDENEDILDTISLTRQQYNNSLYFLKLKDFHEKGEGEDC